MTQANESGKAVAMLIRHRHGKRYSRKTLGDRRVAWGWYNGAHGGEWATISVDGLEDGAYCFDRFELLMNRQALADLVESWNEHQRDEADKVQQPQGVQEWKPKHNQQPKHK